MFFCIESRTFTVTHSSKTFLWQMKSSKDKLNELAKRKKEPGR